MEKTLTFKSGQTGVSYHSLFAEYIADATAITISDPFMSTSLHVESLYEFLNMLLNDCKNLNVKVILKTKDAAENHENLLEIFDEVKAQCETVGLDFSYELLKDCPHQRNVDIDNGWSIYLNNGISIFDNTYLNQPFARLNQELRSTRDFIVEYVKR